MSETTEDTTVIKSCHELDLEAIQKHELYSQRGKELNRLCRLSFEEKVKESLKIIEEALSNHSKSVVACSFGKDSVALLHLVHLLDSTVPVVYTDTGVEFPETNAYARELERKWNLKVFTLKPERTFWNIVDEFGYPRTSRGTKTGDHREPKCCKILKRDPMVKFISEHHPDLVFTGLTSGEGMGRRAVFLRKGNFIYRHETEGTDRCVPLLFWYPEEVFKYFEVENIPLNPCYEKYQIPRIGCIPCTGYIGWEKQLARTFPSLYRKVRHEMGQLLIQDFEEE